ncbi:hypothetical protein K1T71_002964 [Dendrolimus kikuchii]|uniref:Uncharacterized protein n=1 Tax=Dendrolimus kikuchii TaxID=765133 RepID=A0ACC1DAV6_9NEOP|nr:hypothetical protein K1T71_002964 [Dendrolimus kikuchii]
MLLRAFVFSAVIAVIYAGLSSAPTVKNPYYNEEGCFISEFNHSIPFGESVPSKVMCMTYRCSDKYVIHESCGVGRYPDNCEVIPQTDKPYPECCHPIVKCP